MINWYEERIELGVREIVKYLRNNGINTECSCEHDKYVQCQYITDGNVKEIDDLLFLAGFRNYTIEILIKRDQGHIYPTMQITFEDLEEGSIDES
ncbi:hypothetical protein LCGC14_1451440 [marine sediment metagenome]|uniref:Uncharacterized protein n=1 Tax=marine sediment metagenome TaxID=412755 RepID=A0A0F9JHM9_9ZZZZ